jgi:hypothetical protein
MTLPRAYMAMNLRRAVRPGRVAGRARLLGRREGPAAVGVQALDYTVRSHCHFVLSPIHFIPDLLTYSVPLFLKRQCDRTPCTWVSEPSARAPEPGQVAFVLALQKFMKQPAPSSA